jgi:tRNA pseudouridine55 synthase
MTAPEGLLLIDKPSGVSSFFMVNILRRRLKQPKVGHAGTLDPFATGLLILLFGRTWTRQADSFLNGNKEYEATVFLGSTTDTFDCTGQTTSTSPHIPTIDEITAVLAEFQGECLQTPPMYSAKKIDGKRLYSLARQGLTVEREPQKVSLVTTLCGYDYPRLDIHVCCSKGTYIRSLAYDMGQKLGCGAHLQTLRRTRSGHFFVDNALSLQQIDGMDFEGLRTRLLLEVPA